MITDPSLLPHFSGFDLPGYAAEQTSPGGHRIYGAIFPYIGNNILHFYIGVSKNSGIPKWMVYDGKPY